MPTTPSTKVAAIQLLSKHGPTISHIDAYDRSWSASDLSKELNKSEALELYTEVRKLVGAECYKKKNEGELQKKKTNKSSTSSDDVQGVPKVAKRKAVDDTEEPPAKKTGVEKQKDGASISSSTTSSGDEGEK